jgi:hypothetical protein
LLNLIPQFLRRNDHTSACNNFWLCSHFSMRKTNEIKSNDFFLKKFSFQNSLQFCTEMNVRKNFIDNKKMNI